MDDFMSLAQQRYSVRKFSDKPVENEKIEKIIKAGCFAPTACNLQPQRILVINNEAAMEKLKKCTECHFDAPAAMLVCYDKNECWKRVFDGKTSGDIDASIVTTHMMLEAASLGIGTTWVMYYIPEAVKEEFLLPESYESVAILLIGYPSDDAKPFLSHYEFKPTEKLIFYNEF